MIWGRPEVKLIQIGKGLEWAGRKQKGVNWELQGQEGEVMMGKKALPRKIWRAAAAMSKEVSRGTLVCVMQGDTTLSQPTPEHLLDELPHF